MRPVWLAALAASAAAGAARAEVTETWDGGFTVRNVVEVPARADRAFQALGEVGRWWNASHTYSGSSANLSLPLKAGACFCETWPAGSVAHGTVVLARPAQGVLRIDGALGPLQELGVGAALTFKVTPKGDRAEVVQTYTVSGGKADIAKTLAKPVDGVLREQLERYRRFLETGKAD